MKYFKYIFLAVAIVGWVLWCKTFAESIKKKPEMSAMDQCEVMCNSYAQDYSKVLQYSMGTCICDNDEGRKVAEGYHEYLNNQCGKTNESIIHGIR